MDISDNGNHDLEILMKLTLAPIVLGLTVALSNPAAAGQPPDARQKLEDLTSAMKGTAATTRRRVLEDFRRDLEDKVVRFDGTVWTLSSLGLERNKAGGNEMGPALFSWEFQGIQVKGDSHSNDSTGTTANQQAKTRLGGADQATLIIVRSGKYQLYALTAAPEIVDGLRQGAPISVEAQITGLLENSLFGFVTTVHDASTVPRCIDGHQTCHGKGGAQCPSRSDHAGGTAPASAAGAPANATGCPGVHRRAPCRAEGVRNGGTDTLEANPIALHAGLANFDGSGTASGSIINFDNANSSPVLRLNVVVVPEPSGIALCGLLGVFGLARRRKRRNTYGGRDLKVAPLTMESH